LALDLGVDQKVADFCKTQKTPFWGTRGVTQSVNSCRAPVQLGSSLAGLVTGPLGFVSPFNVGQRELVALAVLLSYLRVAGAPEV